MLKLNMHQYKKLLKHVLENGRTKAHRSGFWTRSVFGYTMKFDLQKGFPLVTTKRMPQKVWIRELLWFISGKSNNIKKLQKYNVKIWDEFADENGDIGPMYGYQWRQWPGYDNKPIDQLAEAIKMIKYRPNSSAILVSAWNAGQLKEMRLPPCHTFFQFHVRKDELSMLLYQRSGDVFIGVPFNIAEYALLLMMVAQVTNKKPKEFVHTIGNAHIYKNYKKEIQTQLKRKPLPLPEMYVNPEIKNIDDFTIKDLKVKNYKHHPRIDVAVNVV